MKNAPYGFVTVLMIITVIIWNIVASNIDKNSIEYISTILLAIFVTLILILITLISKFWK